MVGLKFMNILKLKCPNCANIRTWDKDLDKSPGRCYCKTRQYWKVLSKEEVKNLPKLNSKGFVRLLKDNGYHNLKGPSYCATEFF